MDSQKKTSKAAQELSKLGASKGGQARALSLTPEERRTIAKKAVQARWSKTKKFQNLPKTTHKGDLEIGDLKIPCFVLEDGTRVISGRGMTKAIGMKGRGQGMQRILNHRTLKDYINKDLSLAIQNPLIFDGGGPLPTFGYEADILRQICESMLRARDNDALKTEQEIRYGIACDILIRAFAKVGIIALVDEATGYQDFRTRKALQEILERFIAKELRPWVKTFQDDYYKEIFRLNLWEYAPSSVKRPVVIGKWTNDIIYERLAPGVKEELQRIAERDDKGRPKHKLFQRLSEDSGHPKLREHLAAVIALMKASNDWRGFKALLNRALPKFHTDRPLPFDEGK